MRPSRARSRKRSARSAPSLDQVERENLVIRLRKGSERTTSYTLGSREPLPEFPPQRTGRARNFTLRNCIRSVGTAGPLTKGALV